ncbi:MAG: ArgE/DapE family deacylase [Anaerolineae bacterium]|nr:ArgE/DapE family deacylase [Anaerolineae bacterium]
MNEPHLKQVSDWIEAHQDEIVQTLAALVKIPSVIGNEAPAQAFMRQQYEQAGLEIDEFEPDYAILSQHPAFVDSGIPFAGRRNVIGTWRSSHAGSCGRSIALNGHTDLVSAEPLGAWHYDPFAATIIPSSTSKLGRMIGRGTQDMKSGVIANLFAVKALQACGVKLKGDVILQSVIEEESGGGGGTLACFERAKQQGRLPDGLIATEPHWLDVCIAHPGILYFRVIVEGKSAHAGRAHDGINAAVEAAPIISMLGEWDKERAATKHYEPFERSNPAARRSCHLNVGMVQAGDWPSTVPGRCEIAVRMSFIPGETEQGIKAEIAARVHAISQNSAWLRAHPPKIEYFGWHTDPWVQDENHPFVQEFVQLVQSVRGGPDPLPTIMGMTAGLDTRFAQLYGVPAFAWGPKGANLHGANEYVELDSVIDTTRVLAAFLMQWCGKVAEL